MNITRTVGLFLKSSQTIPKSTDIVCKRLQPQVKGYPIILTYFRMKMSSTLVSKATEKIEDSPLSTGSDSSNTGTAPANQPEKRAREEDSESKSAPKKLKTECEKIKRDEDIADRKRKKFAIMMMYSGVGYLGMQRNRGYKTIEEDLLEALLKCNMITQSHWEQPGRLYFQRAARTDKGVSAAGQVISVKLNLDARDHVEKINTILPPQIRVIDIKRTTKGFDSKHFCDARTYFYLTPTFAFTPMDQMVLEDFRMSEEIRQEVNRLLQKYKGTHNFHNFTSQKKPDDPSAKRYLMDLECGPPFDRNGVEFCIISVKGQSFMLHQIRKMIGMVIAIMRGYANEEYLDKSWGPDRMDVPRAPGLGLMLGELHYAAYNEKFASDGTREQLNWSEYEDQMQKFKEEFIFCNIEKTEKEEKSMLNWLATLPLHAYGTYDVNQGRDRSPLAQAADLIGRQRQDQEAAAVAEQSNPSEEGPTEDKVVNQGSSDSAMSAESSDVQKHSPDT